MDDEKKQALQDLKHHDGYQVVYGHWSVERECLLANLLRAARVSTDPNIRGAVAMIDRTDQMIRTPQTMIDMSYTRKREEEPNG